MTDDGIIIRIHLEKVSTMGRATQGVRLIKPQEGTFVSAVSMMAHSEENSEENEEEKSEE
jgi:DNA gyrase subunit A